MLHPNIEQKLARTVKELKELSVLNKRELPNLLISEEFSPSDLKNEDFKKGNIPFFPLQFSRQFVAKNKYHWIKGKFDIPDLGENVLQYLRVDPCIDIKNITLRPQGLLYLNGEIVQGIDVNHRDVLLKPGHYEMKILFYTHDLIEKFNLEITIKEVDARINRTYWDFDIPNQVFGFLETKDDNYFKMSPVLEKACNIIDFREPYSDSFYKSLDDASKYLYNHFYSGVCGSDITVNVIGHSHIDVAWLWDYDQTREKVKRTTASALKLMEEYPEYKFMASTPQLYQFLKEDAPELYEKVKQRQKEGRWEVEGALYLECDCNLTGSESLVRQIVYGKKFIKEEFGVDSKVVWLPDVFGYSGALPQIMKKAGVEKFVTAKIGWNDTNRFPYDTFIWKGIDGSAVNAFLISTPDACNPRTGVYDITYTTYCSEVDPKYILGTWHRYSQKDYSNTVFMTMGFGDGGGGPTREMLESQRRFSYGLPGIPKTKISTIEETLSEIKENFDKNCKELNRTPIWNGELYFEFHRGTLTSVPMVKKYNRMLENLIMSTEASSVICNSLINKDYEDSLLENNWKILILNQFHDVIPGSSIEKVYDDAYELYQGVEKEVGQLHKDNLDLLAEQVDDEGYLVYNSNPFEVTSNVRINGATYVVDNIPSYGYKVIKDLDKESHLIIKDRYLENEFYSIKFNLDGSISSLFDKRENRELVEEGKSLNQLVAYEDMAFEYDNWELAPYHKQKEYPLNEQADFQKVVDNQRVALKIIKKYCNSSIIQEISLYNGLDRIDIKCDIDWKEKNQILKSLFPLDIKFDAVNYDIQFGHVSRNNHLNNSIDSACFESCAHKWIDASENNYGFAILNDGKYGFGAEENVLSISLIKSGSFPNEHANKIVPTFTYSLLPHKGNLTNSSVIKEGYILNRPLEVRRVNKVNNGLDSIYSFVKTSSEGVYIETIKKAMDDDSYVLRMYEGFKERKIVTLEFATEINKAEICDLLENKISDLTVIDNHFLSFEIKPFEIITIKIK